MTFPMFGEFMTKLQDAFKVVNPIDLAMQKLALLWQGNRPIEELITGFRLLIGDARLSTDSPSDQIHLIKMFMTCLNPQLKKKIIFRDIVPKTIEDWYTKAIQYDSNYWMAQALQALDNQVTPKKAKTWFNQNQTQKDPNTMDIGSTTTKAATSNGTALIGALTQEMRTALMKIGACFRCRKTGHMSRNCLDRNRSYGAQQPQAQTPKMYTPKDVHTNIRSMTAEQRKELMEMLTVDSGF